MARYYINAPVYAPPRSFGGIPIGGFGGALNGINSIPLSVFFFRK